MGVRGEVFSSRATSGSRTYFFNVKENRAGDLFLNIVESKKHGESGFERHQVVVFEEDLREFLAEFQKAADFMKNNARGGRSHRRDDRKRRGPGHDDRSKSDNSDSTRPTVKVKRRRPTENGDQAESS